MGSTDVARAGADVGPSASTLRFGARLYVGVLVGLLLVAGVLLIVLPSGVLDPVTSIDSVRTAVFLGIGVLALDAVAPVPSSAVMIALGATIGVVPATLASTAGLAASAVIGYGIGRAGGRVVGLEPGTVDRLSSLLRRRRGVIAVIATRPIPMLAESTATVAGVVRMPFGRFAAAAVLGSSAPALVYAIVGTGLATWPTKPLVVAATVIVVLVAEGARRVALR